MRRNLTVFSAVLVSWLIVLPGGDCQALSPQGAMKKLRKRYRSVKTLQAHFVEMFEWAMTGETVRREGSLVITADDRFRIDTPEQLIVSDGETVFRYNRTTSKVIIEPVGGDKQEMLPRRMMLGFADEFKATALAELPVAGRPGFRLDMIPDDPEEVMITGATLWVSAADLVVRRLKLVDLNGNSTTYILSDVSFDLPVDSTVTTFVVPDGVELFDLR